MKNYFLFALLIISSSKIAFAAPSYLPVGPQQNIPVATVTNGGWEECYSDLYDNSLNQGAVLASCTGTDLMLACRPTGDTTLQLLAQAPRADALFDTPNDTPHIANGSGWYFDPDSAWGFVNGGDSSPGSPCDIENSNGGQRLCWHGQGNGGYRCGANKTLNNSAAFERIVYQPALEVGFYEPVGPQTNIPVSTVENGGWTECYRDTYATGGVDLATIQANCPGADLMLACRPTGSATLQLLAQANRLNVLFDTGIDTTTTHNANGSEWYYNDSRSWGFAAGGDAVNKASCDTTDSSDPQRLCWHTGSGNLQSGYRCGDDNGLNGNATFERIIYQANGFAAPTLFGDCDDNGVINILDVICTINKVLAGS